jgi:hypothetical protein
MDDELKRFRRQRSWSDLRYRRICLKGLSKTTRTCQDIRCLDRDSIPTHISYEWQALHIWPDWSPVIQLGNQSVNQPASQSVNQDQDLPWIVDIRLMNFHVTGIQGLNAWQLDSVLLLGTSHSGGLGFKSRPWIRLNFVFFKHSKQMPEL